METHDQSEILAAMQKPDFYPHAVQAISLRETHISRVVLTGEIVYKIKKPVDMEFLDFTTLEKRLHFCKAEVALNRRLTRDVYLDVVAITRKGNRYILNGPGRTVEYAVKMRQLPQDSTMRKRLRKGRLDSRNIDSLARVLGQFYNRADSGTRIDAFGSLATIRQNCEENFAQINEFVGKMINLRIFLFIRSTTRSFLRRRKTLFKRRIENGKIRECHGDLRAGHIYFVNDGIQIIDCIEFNKRFRCGDVASDLAFLAMDLDFEGFTQVARSLLKAYARFSDDQEVFILLDFYKCYRALVRVKVNCLRLQQTDLAEAQRAELLEEIQRYMDLACRYAELLVRPAVWVVCGMAATGKSTISKKLADKFGIRKLSSDLIRKKLIMDRNQSGLGFEEGIYSKEATSITYGKLLRLAREEIEKQNSVILDATFSRKKYRREALRLAEELDANIIFLECVCSDSVIKDRLQKRNTVPSISDARLEHFENLIAAYEPLDDIPRDIHITIDTQNSLDDNIMEILSSDDLPIPG
jgi:aminoglycoside phosphotransferase family enzyme/predicted kinase